jgi:two-component system, chemotaxis family, response regulator Rcp1
MEDSMPNLVVLLVEDNPEDASTLQRSFRQHLPVPYQFNIVPDGEAALAFLQQQGAYAHAPRPHLIILDIGLPTQDGWEVLAAIRATPSLSTIPVVMLAGVLSGWDKKQRDALHPPLCLVKPFPLKGYQGLVETIGALLNSTESR